jgi:HSP20 family protein
MKLIPKDPFINAFPQMKDLHRLFNFEFEDDDNTLTPADWTPAVDIAEKEDHFLINADIPGVDPKDIEVSMENGFLTVKGERESETKDEKNGYSRVERTHGSFYRRFSLPESADSGKVSASSNKGVLEIKVGKTEVAKPKKIMIDVQ